MSPRRLTRLLTEKELDRRILLELFDFATTLEHKPSDCMRGKVLMTYTDEDSTRTMSSSNMAALRLGGRYIHIPSRGSSEGKGETFEDTVVTLAAIGADILAIRHHDEDAIFRAAARVAQFYPIPIVNCGSGGMHHPTQAAGDVFTVFRECKTLDNLKIACIGGLDNSRAINSFIYLLLEWTGITLYLVAPDKHQLKGSLRLYLEDNKDRMKVIETTDLNEVLPLVDVVYQSRIQWNHDQNPEAARHEAPPYVLSRQNVASMRKDAIILHPWPRNLELLREVDLLPQQRYIKLMRNATLMRMAIFANMVGYC